MRKIVLFIASSLDGFIAGPKGQIDWLFSDADYGYNKFFGSVDTVLMGRKTFELSLSFKPFQYPNKRVVVFSRNKKNKIKSTAEFVSEPVSFTCNLKKQKGKDIWLVGGGELASLFLKKGLIDEIVLSIHPIVLGKGIPLFSGAGTQAGLTLKKSKSFASGLVQLQYAVQKR